jgi:hypothetical protein
MKKLLFILLIIFSSTVSFAQVRAKVVLGNQHRQHRYHQRHYVQHRYHHPYRRPHRSRVVLKARL